MEQQTIQPRTVADAPPTCDQAECREAAVFSYMWEWGAQGVCCAKHQFMLQQSSQSLARTVNFAPLQTAAVAITRDERAKLKGEVYALTEELEDSKGRGLELYRENTRLTQQVQALVVRGRETEAQLEEARRELAAQRDRLEARDAEHGGLVEELQRLRTLEKYTEPRKPTEKPKQSTAGLEGESTTVVDGPPKGGKK